MKKAVIAVLIISVVGLGFWYFTKGNTSLPSSSSEATAVKGSGKTLDLSNKGLTKVSHDVLNDSSVTTFDVSGNNLTGALPGEIKNLTNLEILIASDNNLTGIPAEIGQLSKLKTANFANNNISGLPLEIGNLKNLETLDLRGNPNVSKYDISKIQPQIPNAKILTD